MRNSTRHFQPFWIAFSLGGILLFLTGCQPDPVEPSCDFNFLMPWSSIQYDFDGDTYDFFQPEIALNSHAFRLEAVAERITLFADAIEPQQEMESRMDFVHQLPANRPWDISMDIGLPASLNQPENDQSRFAMGIFAAKVTLDGIHQKGYYGLMEQNKNQRYVVAEKLLDPSTKAHIRAADLDLAEGQIIVRLKLEYCAESYTIRLYADGQLLHTQGLDLSGENDWEIDLHDQFEIGIIGFVRDVVSFDDPPWVDHFEMNLY